MKNLSSFLLCAAAGLCLTSANLAAANAPQNTVALGQAAHFAVLAHETVTNAGLSIINGDLGVSPGSAVTGFLPIEAPGKVNGTIYTPNQFCTRKACVVVPNTVAATGQTSLLVAYNDAAGRTVGPVDVAGDLGGLTLAPGLYKSTSGLGITGDLTLSGKGIYIFQIESGLTVSTLARVVLTGGAQAADVFWQVGSSATLGTYSKFKGTILALTSISIAKGGTLDGRALALNAAVTLDTNVVTIPIVVKSPKK